MARKYPRFLYSNAQNTKNAGHFIVHTLHPKAILKFIPVDSLEFNNNPSKEYPFSHCSFSGDVILLDSDECSLFLKMDLCSQAYNWLVRQDIPGLKFN